MEEKLVKKASSDRSRAVRWLRKFRFDCDHESWEDYWERATRPCPDFVEAVLNRSSDELPLEERALIEHGELYARRHTPHLR